MPEIDDAANNQEKGADANVKMRADTGAAVDRREMQVVEEEKVRRAAVEEAHCAILEYGQRAAELYHIRPPYFEGETLEPRPSSRIFEVRIMDNKGGEKIVDLPVVLYYDQQGTTHPYLINSRGRRVQLAWVMYRGAYYPNTIIRRSDAVAEGEEPVSMIEGMPDQLTVDKPPVRGTDGRMYSVRIVNLRATGEYRPTTSEVREVTARLREALNPKA